LKTLLRTLIALSIVVWLGGLLFFPVVAQITFSTLTDKHAAGLIVGACLRTLHYEGMAWGALLLVLLFVAGRLLRRTFFAAMALVVIMLGLTALSQFAIILRMETYRIAGGGDIRALPAGDPNYVGFERLHRRSVRVEEGVMVAGLLLIVALAWADSREPRP
jgi:hypothetical protein